jgi:hypothetical protein
MKIKQSVSSILNKQMNRQDFLKHIAIGVVALSGAGAALRLLAPEEKAAPPVAKGYGGSAYGGDEEGKA